MGVSVPQLALAFWALIVSLGVYWLQRRTSQQVASFPRSRPTGKWLDFVNSQELNGNRMHIIQRFGTTEEGLPYTKVEEIIPANCSLPGGYKKHKCGPPPHIHRFQDEIFRVLKGSLGTVVDKKEVIITPADGDFLIPMGKIHTFFPAYQDQETHATCTVVTRVGNSTDFGWFLATFYGLSRDYGDAKKINPFQVLLTLTEGGGLDLALPKPMRYIIRYGINPLSKLFGYRALYDVYLPP